MNSNNPSNPSENLDPDIEDELNELLARMEEDLRTGGYDRLGIIGRIEETDSQRTNAILDMMSFDDLQKYQKYFMGYYDYFNRSVLGKVIDLLGEKLTIDSRNWLAEFGDEYVHCRLIDIWGETLTGFEIWYLIKKGTFKVHKYVFKALADVLDSEHQGMLFCYTDKDNFRLKVLNSLEPNVPRDVQKSIAICCGEKLHHALLDIVGSKIDSKAKEELLNKAGPSIKKRLQKE